MKKPVRTRRLVIKTTIDVPEDVTMAELAQKLDVAKIVVDIGLFPDNWNANMDAQIVVRSLLDLGLGKDIDPASMPDVGDIDIGTALRHLVNGGGIVLVRAGTPT